MKNIIMKTIGQGFPTSILSDKNGKALSSTPHPENKIKNIHIFRHDKRAKEK